MHRAELQLPVPCLVCLPFQVLEDGDFPHLDLTLEQLGIRPEQVTEKVVRLDSQRSRVRSAKGRLREREVSALEIQLTVHDPLTRASQQIRYGSESSTDRRLHRTLMELRPWLDRAQAGADEAVEEEEEEEGTEADLEDVDLIIHTESESHPKWQRTQEIRTV